jgi:hypothetical protein
MTTDPRNQRNPRGRQNDGRHDGHGLALGGLAVAEDHAGWVSRSRVTLTPIAAPSIMGLFGFMIATLIFPFAAVAGGLLQGIAAIVSFRHRDGVAVAVHTAWAASGSPGACISC